MCTLARLVDECQRGILPARVAERIWGSVMHEVARLRDCQEESRSVGQSWSIGLQIAAGVIALQTLRAQAPTDAGTDGASGFCGETGGL